MNQSLTETVSVRAVQYHIETELGLQAAAGQDYVCIDLWRAHNTAFPGQQWEWDEDRRKSQTKRLTFQQNRRIQINLESLPQLLSELGYINPLIDRYGRAPRAQTPEVMNVRPVSPNLVRISDEQTVLDRVEQCMSLMSGLLVSGQLRIDPHWPNVQSSEIVLPRNGIIFTTVASVKGLVEQINSVNKITTLSLSGNAFSVEAITAIADALSNHSVDCLLLENITATLPRFEAQMALSAFFNRLDSRTLKSINLACNALGWGCIASIWNIVALAHSLLSLNLRDTGLSDESLLLIAMAIEEGTFNARERHATYGLREIDLSENNFSRMSQPLAKRVGLAFEGMENLREVSFNGCRLSAPNTAALLTGLADLPLSKLEMSDAMVDELCLVSLSTIIGHGQLRSLNLGGWAANDPDLSLPLLDTLVRNRFSLRQLETLDLSANEISNAGISALTCLLEELTNLRSLDLTDNEFENDACSDLQRFTQAIIVCDTESSAGDTSVDQEE
jgi:Ran GTPase-activating protein (RanGAP) involved in mRNA processing and transport